MKKKKWFQKNVYVSMCLVYPLVNDILIIIFIVLIFAATTLVITEHLPLLY